LLDLIVNISPDEDQLYVGLQKSKATAVQHQWNTDTLAAISLVARVEGADATFAARTNPTRSSNWTQIITSEFQVSSSDRASNPAGFKDRYSYEMQKAMREWRRFADYAVLRSTLISGTGSAARQMQGIKYAISTLSTAQSGVSLSENIMNTYLQNAWNQGGNVNMLLVGGTLKRRISGFTNTNTRFVNADTKQVYNAIDTYDSDFGRVEVHKHRWVTVSGDNNLDIVGLEKEKWAIAHLDEPHYEEIAKTGLSSKGMIAGELTVEARAENSSFIGFAHL